MQVASLRYGSPERLSGKVISEQREPDLSRMRAVFNDFRERSGMTYDELAEASGVSRRTLLHISSGKYAGDLKTWLILARVWGVRLDDLFARVWD